MYTSTLHAFYAIISIYVWNDYCKLSILVIVSGIKRHIFKGHKEQITPVLDASTAKSIVCNLWGMFYTINTWHVALQIYLTCIGIKCKVSPY